MGIPDLLTWLRWNLYAGQKPTGGTRHGTTDWFKIRKGVHQAVNTHPTYLTFMQSTLWEMPGWMTHKLESRLLGENQQPQICRWYHCNGRKWRGTKEPLDECERGEWKSWLKIQHSKMKIMACGPITSWKIDEEKVETDRLHFLGLQNHCRRWLQPWN